MPRGGYAPTLRGVEPASTSTRRCSPARSRWTDFSNGNLTPEEKRDVIAYLNSLEETPTTAASAWAASAR